MEHFERRWTCNPQVEYLESQIIQPRISNTQNSHLIKPMLEAKIENVLKDMNPNKALGPDGFPPFFFQNF